jgi:hypothetical protein
MLLWHFYKIGVPPTALKALAVELTPPVLLFLLQQKLTTSFLYNIELHYYSGLFFVNYFGKNSASVYY